MYRTLAQATHLEWPTYESNPLYDQSSLGGFEADIRTLAGVWFEHDAHESVEEFVSHLPLAYVDFRPYDCYTGSTRYEMATLVRMFLLRELHGWDHETALVEYLECRSDLCGQLGVETVPDQSTLWRSWHERFTPRLRETIKSAARTILITAENCGVAAPREPDRKLRDRDGDGDDSLPNDTTVLERAETITDHVTRVVFPAFSLDRGDGCEIHENAFWDLQTYLGLRENLAANEGARSFVHESTRDRTPLGHAHREHVRDQSIPEIREMYRRAIGRLVDEVAETEEFYRAACS